METLSTQSQASDQQSANYFTGYEQYQGAQEAISSQGAAMSDASTSQLHSHQLASAETPRESQQQQLQQQAEHDFQSDGGYPPLLLVTTVDIGEGKTDRIEVRQGDVPLEVAHAFVAKHNLPVAVVPRLAMHLEENLLKVEAQRRAAGSQAGSEEGLAVFHRLYQQAVALRQKMETRREVIKRSEMESIQNNKTSMSWISSEMMRDRGAGPFDNYGEMLYAESLESLARKRDKAQRVKAQRDIEEVQGVTFHPEISRHAQTIWGPHEVGSVPVWQRLSKVKMTKAQERLEMLRREKEEAEVRECTFKPQISGRSEKLMTERSQTLRSLNVSAHQQLYQDAIRRQQKQQDYQHWYPEEVTFQPKLNESAMSREFLRKSLQKEGSSLAPNASGAERHMALVNRLYASYEKLQNKLAEARSTLQNSVDPATGRRLFHPATGRAPRFTRNTTQQPVSEYLYSLSHQQDEKFKAAAQERERRVREEAATSKQAHGSKQLIRALQHKRFKQIFEFLDADGLGSIDLVAIMSASPDWLDDLDDEVRADLEAAARLLHKRSLKHTESNNSNTSGSTIFMPPPPGQDMTDFGGINMDGIGISLPPTPSSCPARTVFAFNAFCGLMEEVLATRRGPRAYLAPSPTRKYVPTDTYKPQINQRSKQLASRVRPKDTPAYEVLYQENSVISQKLSEKRAQREAERIKQCTFTPQLVSQQLVKEGRVMKAVREGSWWTRGDTDSQLCELEGVNSLQQLAASVMGDDDDDDHHHALLAVEDDEDDEEQQPQAEEEEEAGQGSPAAAAAGTSAQQAGIAQQQQQQGSASPPRGVHAQGQPALRAVTAGFASSEEQQQYLELEREVAEMQKMLEEATAAAERGQQSHSDQQYLSEILGLAQEQVDAMAPALSKLQGLEVHHSPSASAASDMQASSPQLATWDGGVRGPPNSTGASASAASSQPMSIQHTPKSSFRVTEDADGTAAAQGSAAPAAAAAAEPPSGAAAAAAAPGAPPSASLSGASPGQLQHAVAAALQELTSSSDADFVSKALALSKMAAAGGYAEGLHSGLISAGINSNTNKLGASATLEGADLFELAAGAAGGGDRSRTQQDHLPHAAAMDSLEELAAAMNMNSIIT